MRVEPVKPALQASHNLSSSCTMARQPSLVPDAPPTSLDEASALLQPAQASSRVRTSTQLDANESRPSSTATSSDSLPEKRPHSAFFMVGPDNSEADIETGLARPLSRIDALQRERSKRLRSTYTTLTAQQVIVTGPEPDDRLQCVHSALASPGADWRVAGRDRPRSAVVHRGWSAIRR